MKKQLLFVAVIVTFILAGCAGRAAQPKTLKPITFQAAYLAQGNISFAAAYVAKEKGFFAEQGLDVTIEHSSPGGGEQLQRLAAKDIQFTTNTGANFVKLVAEQSPPFVAVSVLGQEGDHGILVLEDSGITKIGDLAGKRVGYKSGEAIEPPWLLAMLKEAGLDLKSVEMVTVGFDPRVVLPDYGEGRVDALQVFKSNEPDTLQRAGYKVEVFKPEDYGVHFLGQLYITHQDFIRDDPEMVRGFVRATLKGLEFILDPANANEVTDIVMKYAGKDADRGHNEFMWKTEAQYVTSKDTEAVGLGYVSNEAWQEMMNVMVEYGSIKEPVAVDRFWDPQFVQAVYKNGKLVWP
ncbi:MAG: ABC transporter substrate-binding protein [Ardenticatenaceae bacterium]|nr:ABC transporter substrate-binding protein [Ardenticatenaceae bacterium]